MSAARQPASLARLMAPALLALVLGGVAPATAQDNPPAEEAADVPGAAPGVLPDSVPDAVPDAVTDAGAGTDAAPAVPEGERNILNPLSDIAPDTIENFVTRPLFVESRRAPPKEEPQPEEPPVEEEPPPEEEPVEEAIPPPTLQLSGVVEAGADSIAVLRDPSGVTATSVRLKGDVEGWTVTKILPTAITLERDGAVLELKLFQPGPSQPPSGDENAGDYDADGNYIGDTPEDQSGDVPADGSEDGVPLEEGEPSTDEDGTMNLEGTGDDTYVEEPPPADMYPEEDYGDEEGAATDADADAEAADFFEEEQPPAE